MFFDSSHDIIDSACKIIHTYLIAGHHGFFFFLNKTAECEKMLYNYHNQEEG